MSSRGMSAVGLIALVALIVVWHLLVSPPRTMPAWTAIGLHLAPLLPALWLLVRRRPHMQFWGGLGALVLFCHGVSEAWSAPEVRVLALTESILCVAVILAAGWDGMRARLGKSRGV